MVLDISVVIPVYNGEAYLVDCIRSVLTQTRKVSDIIVVDDGSKDDTPRIAAQMGDRIKYVRQDNEGMSSARNAGLKLVHTEFISFLDCDDLWMPRKIELQMDALSQETEPAMAFGHVCQFPSEELPAEERARFRYQGGAVPGWIATNLLLRSSDFRRAGLFDTSLRVGEFIEWFARARDRGIKPVMLPEQVSRRRLHRGNLGKRRPDLRQDYARTLKNIIDRRREETE